MRITGALLLLLLLQRISLGEVALAANQQAFREALARKVEALQKANTAVAPGADGWLFLTSELRFLAQGRFWGEAAARTSRAHKADAADPIPAIVDFNRQLHERGIELLLVPVPPKAAIYPEKIGLEPAISPALSAPYLQQFYAELRQRGINVADLTAVFAAKLEGKDARGPLYCRTDSHWSGVGCAIAGETIAQQVRAKLGPAPAQKTYTAEYKEISATGDLAALIGGGARIAPETIMIRQVSPAVQPDPNSPVLLLGDSHTLVFHEFLGEHAGLLDQLAAALGFAPDLIGTRGSGATPVRTSMYQRSRSDPQFLAKKKVVIWCFAARDFTEADEGWRVQPIAK